MTLKSYPSSKQGKYIKGYQLTYSMYQLFMYFLSSIAGSCAMFTFFGFNNNYYIQGSKIIKLRLNKRLND